MIKLFGKGQGEKIVYIGKIYFKIMMEGLKKLRRGVSE